MIAQQANYGRKGTSKYSARSTLDSLSKMLEKLSIFSVANAPIPDAMSEDYSLPRMNEFPS